MTLYDVKAPKDAFDAHFKDFIRGAVAEFDLSKPLSDQVGKLVKDYFSAVSLQWSLKGLNIYPLASDEMHGWAFQCPWSVLREEAYVFAASRAQSDGSAFDEESLQDIVKLRDALAKVVKILDRDISTKTPSDQTMQRF